MLLVCRPTRDLISLNWALIEDARRAALSIVPELRSGEVEIVNIAREYGVACKIAVRMRSGEPSERAVTICVGASGSGAKMIASIVAGESVTFVPWSEDIRDYIVGALSPLKADDVEVVRIDAERRIAHVEVAQQYVFRQEFSTGTEDINSKLASQLTGYLVLPTVKERRTEDEPERDPGDPCARRGAGRRLLGVSPDRHPRMAAPLPSRMRSKRCFRGGSRR